MTNEIIKQQVLNYLNESLKQKIIDELNDPDFKLMIENYVDLVIILLQNQSYLNTNSPIIKYWENTVYNNDQFFVQFISTRPELYEPIVIRRFKNFSVLKVLLQIVEALKAPYQITIVKNGMTIHPELDFVQELNNKRQDPSHTICFTNINNGAGFNNENIMEALKRINRFII